MTIRIRWKTRTPGSSWFKSPVVHIACQLVMIIGIVMIADSEIPGNLIHGKEIWHGLSMIALWVILPIVIAAYSFSD